MRILLSAYQCSPGRGSEPGTGWHWVMALTDLGHEVTVLTSSPDREAIRAAGIQGADFRFIDAAAMPLLRRWSPMLANCATYLRWQVAALRHIESTADSYDLAHHVTWGGLHLGTQLWRLPIPLVYGPIGGGQTAPAGYLRYFGSGWPAEVLRTASTGPLLKLVKTCRQTIRNSAVTLVDNSATFAACRRLGSPDVRLSLSYGLPQDWIVGARERPTGRPTVLWVGRLIPRKAPVIAVETFAELRRVMPARMVIAGDGPMRAQVAAAIERLGLAGDVEMLGNIAWDDIRGLYDSATVLLFASLRESFGAPFLEALGRGLPIVALDLHGIADAEVGPAALKVALPPNPRDLPLRLAAGLRTVLTDDEWASRSAAAVKWAADWVWPVKAVAATQLYQEIVGSKG